MEDPFQDDDPDSETVYLYPLNDVCSESLQKCLWEFETTREAQLQWSMMDALDRKRALAKLLEIGNGYWNESRDFRRVRHIIPDGMFHNT